MAASSDTQAASYTAGRPTVLFTASLGQERLPADWTGPEQGIGFLSTFRLVQKIGGMETNVSEKETG